MRYSGEKTGEISFPLGGIGSGSIGLAGNGNLIDWEIFNKPAKGSINGYSHFFLKAVQKGKVTSYVLNGDIQKDFVGKYKQAKFTGYGFGPESRLLCGFPHFREVSFCGEFPFAELTFADQDFPAKVQMTAFNPLIPNDADNSSIPAAFFEFTVENPTDDPAEYELAFAVTNPFPSSENRAYCDGNHRMITLSYAGADPKSVDYGDLTLAAEAHKSVSQTYWYRGTWMDNIVTFWNDFNTAAPLQERDYDSPGSGDTAVLSTRISLAPGQSGRVRYVLSWNVPNNYNYWNELRDEEGNHRTWRNYYAVLFASSRESARYAMTNWDSLCARTRAFHDMLYASTLPETVIDAAASNLAVLKSPTVLRLEDGSFYGWEGVHEREGSCEGTCQHVWNYAYALCFLFPKLERSIRDNELLYSMAEDGRTGFRLQLPLGREMTDFRACLDGQMGLVIKCFREWKLSGDDSWLKKHWNRIQRVLAYAWSPENPDCWDLDKDGVLEGRQHHTLDMELFGPSSWLQGMYLAALKAAGLMAAYLGDTEKEKEYMDLFEKGYAWTRDHLFNGRYFIQKIDLTDRAVIDRFGADRYWNEESGQIKYQIAEGSSIDQMLGQWHADILGLGDIFDPEQIAAALDSMMKYNYKPTMRDHVNPWRIFSLYDEAGSVICDYPDVEKPKIPVPYCEETMTGFEYSFAGLLCSRGRIPDGLKAAKAVRDRFTSGRRNPWNEFECGSNYARSMASFALIPILSGFEFDLPHHSLGFCPRWKAEQADAFRTFWSVDGAWGAFSFHKNADTGACVMTLNVQEGEITLSSLGVKFLEEGNAADGCTFSLCIDGQPAECSYRAGVLSFDQKEIRQKLEITAESAGKKE